MTHDFVKGDLVLIEWSSHPQLKGTPAIFVSGYKPGRFSGWQRGLALTVTGLELVYLKDIERM